MPFKKVDPKQELKEFLENDLTNSFDAKKHFESCEEYNRTLSDCYLIPISYSVSGHICIPKTRASSLEEAIKIAKEDDSIPLPTGDDVEYIDDSFKVNEDMFLIEVMNNRK